MASLSRISHATCSLISSPVGRTLVLNSLLTLPSTFWGEAYKRLHRSDDQSRFSLVSSDAEVKNLNPIFLVHGKNGDVSDFDQLIPPLKVLNRPIYLIRLGANNFTSVETDAGIVHQVMEDLFSNSDVALDLDFIGHSKGGVVLHEFAKNFSHPKVTIRKVITLGSPHLGTPLSAFVGGQVESDLGPNGPLVQDHKNYFNDERFYYIGNSRDPMIPIDSSIPEGIAEDHQLTIKSLYGHHLLPSSPDAQKQILTWLN